MSRAVGCITQPVPGALQARIGRRSVGWFPLRAFGGDVEMARRAAQARIDQVAASLPPPRCPTLTPQANNQSSDVRGVNRCVKYDRRRDQFYLVFQVYWKDTSGKSRNKCFHVGGLENVTEAAEAEASAAAEAFRTAYVHACQNRETFNPAPWDAWRTSNRRAT